MLFLFLLRIQRIRSGLNNFIFIFVFLLFPQKKKKTKNKIKENNENGATPAIQAMHSTEKRIESIVLMNNFRYGRFILLFFIFFCYYSLHLFCLSLFSLFHFVVFILTLSFCDNKCVVKSKRFSKETRQRKQ